MIWSVFTPNLFALVSDEITRIIFVSTHGWNPLVSSFYYDFYYYDKAQLRDQIKLNPGLKPNLKHNQINWVSILSKAISYVENTQ